MGTVPAPAAAAVGATGEAVVAVPQRGGMPIAMVAIGLLLFVGAGVAAAVMFLGGRNTEPDLRAGGPAPVYSPERQVVNDFFREARDPDASFEVAMTGTISVTAPVEFVMEFDGTMQMHGSDWLGTMTLSGIPDTEPMEMQAALIEGVGYAAVEGVQDWTQTDDPIQTGPVNPFGRIAAASEVEYLGYEGTGSTTLHHLLVTKWIGGNDFDAALAGVRVTDKENTVHIWVTPEGVPTRAEYVMTINGTVQGQAITMGADVTYTFSDWGEIAPILPPI